CTRSDYYAVW
nr:immunoglobulin heavy chain junction region [Mus musculus]